MGTVTASSFPISSGASNYDEDSMKQSLLFSDSLKDLKNLRTQLYSAAEYFELSYSNDDQKLIVVETLRDYAIKALVNAVDHLGSVTYKVNDLLGEKVDEVSGTELRVSCIEQRIRTCQELMDREGLSQQSLVINTPKFHKRYILPGEALNSSTSTNLKYGYSFDDEDDWRQFKNAVRAKIRDSPPARKSVQTNRGRSASPSPQPPPQRSGTFHFTSITRKELENRTISPGRFPLVHSGSLASMPVAPKTSWPTNPNPIRHVNPNIIFGGNQRLMEPRKSASMRLHVGWEKGKETMEQQPGSKGSKSKRLLMTLLSRRKSKKDDTLYTYLDEY
ncbi:hypothetical protein MLD38_033493 [Melastoma candidum]|uniref:Uncharacterized protein n=1 Tax=Melastoma candidum TaxID=119954 RepID=A0ACB9M6Y5_9MYRT|nr:hypothetical protein MLD38_033493 [Melastoma candidum]